jgi:peptidoglycan/xylan/chitin deacetylase (PgdA/CDA1 family)
LAAAPALWGAYTWGSHLLTLGSIWRGRPGERAAVLTFDDGPDPEWTPRVLDVLAEEGIRGAFFLVGRRAVTHPVLVRRMVSEGHDLGNHTWSHRSLWLSGPRRTAGEIHQGHDAIAQCAGRPPGFFRPPWGMTNLAVFPVLRRLGTPCVFWTIQTEGRRAAAPAAQAERVRVRLSPGAILDLHDAPGLPGAGQRLLEALPGVIAAIRGQGYALVPLRDVV